MSSCESIRRLMFRFSEGEASPEEALRVGRHLPDCTSCRILAARERRLAEMLERDLDDLPVGEEFVRSVMATLPQGPPPRLTRRELAERKRKSRRGLKLAGLGLLVGLLWLPGLGGATGLALPSTVAAVGLPGSLQGGDPSAGIPNLFELAGWVAMALGSFGGDLSTYLPSSPVVTLAMLTLFVPLVLSMLGLVGALACTAVVRWGLPTSPPVAGVEAVPR